MQLVVGLGQSRQRVRGTPAQPGVHGGRTSWPPRRRVRATAGQVRGRDGGGHAGGQRAPALQAHGVHEPQRPGGGRVAGFWKIERERIVVVHDELDLPFGRLKLGAGGGPGGHNGVRSLIATLGPEFARVRVGIGRPPGSRTRPTTCWRFSGRAEGAARPGRRGPRTRSRPSSRSGLTAAMNQFNDASQNAPSKKPDRTASHADGFRVNTRPPCPWDDPRAIRQKERINMARSDWAPAATSPAASASTRPSTSCAPTAPTTSSRW